MDLEFTLGSVMRLLRVIAGSALMVQLPEWTAAKCVKDTLREVVRATGRVGELHDVLNIRVEIATNGQATAAGAPLGPYRLD